MYITIMTKKNYDYDVRCNTCHKKFTVQLFENHEKNLWLVDEKNWYCETCKNEYFKKQTYKLSKSNAESGFPELTGTPKRISWAEKIRAELTNKADFLKKVLYLMMTKKKKYQTWHLIYFYRSGRKKQMPSGG